LEYQKTLGSIEEHPENGEANTVVNLAKQLEDKEHVIDCGREWGGNDCHYLGIVAPCLADLRLDATTGTAVGVTQWFLAGPSLHFQGCDRLVDSRPKVAQVLTEHLRIEGFSNFIDVDKL
jgi:hypothetical protein